MGRERSVGPPTKGAPRVTRTALGRSSNSSDRSGESTAVGKLGSPRVAILRSGFSRSGRAIGGARACPGAFRRCDQVNLGLFRLTSPGACLVGLHLPGSPAGFSRVREKLGDEEPGSAPSCLRSSKHRLSPNFIADEVCVSYSYCFEE